MRRLAQSLRGSSPCSLANGVADFASPFLRAMSVDLNGERWAVSTTSVVLSIISKISRGRCKDLGLELPSGCSLNCRWPSSGRLSEQPGSAWGRSEWPTQRALFLRRWN